MTHPQNPDAAPDPRDAIRDLIHTTLNQAGYWLPIDGQHAIAEAVLKLRNDYADKWRHKAIRRAIELGRLERALEAVHDFATQGSDNPGPWGDGYRTARQDFRELLAIYLPKEQQ